MGGSFFNHADKTVIGYKISDKIILVLNCHCLSVTLNLMTILASQTTSPPNIPANQQGHSAYNG